MQAYAIKPQDDVMVSVDSDSAMHARVVSRLTRKDADGNPLFLVVDDMGMSRIVRDRDMSRLTTHPIQRAEHHIASVITNLALRYSDETEEWIMQCVQELDEALYELSKPEATKIP